jgi:RNA polymerase sigma factor for flagellar operon FliA
MDYDDVVQAALIGLWEAAQRWCPDVGVPFWVYARTRIHGSVVDELRRLSGRRGRVQAVSLNESVDGNMSRLEAVGEEEAGYAKLEDEQEADLVLELMGELPERLRLVLWLRHCEGLTLREIGEIMGVTEGRVCQLVYEAMNRMRRLAA